MCHIQMCIRNKYLDIFLRVSFFYLLHFTFLWMNARYLLLLSLPSAYNLSAMDSKLIYNIALRRCSDQPLNILSDTLQLHADADPLPCGSRTQALLVYINMLGNLTFQDNVHLDGYLNIAEEWAQIEQLNCLI